MRRLVALLLCIMIVLCSGCGDSTSPTGSAPKPNTKDETPIKQAQTQYTIAMNPSVVFQDGSVVSVRRDVSVSMKADLEEKRATKFYNDTNWQWISRNTADEWNLRLIRDLELWKNGSGKSKDGVPYAYSFTDDRASSLAVYDISQIQVDGYGEGEVPDKGILFSFTGDAEEALCYTASEDCTVDFCDTSSSNIALVKSVSGVETDVLGSGKAVGVVVRVYLNNRLMWQNVLGNAQLLDSQVSSVPFPEFKNIEMSKDDSILITAQAIYDASDIVTGYNDFPEYTSVVKKPIKVKREIEITEEEEKTSDPQTIPFIDENGLCNFTIVRPEECDNQVLTLIASLRSQMKKTLETDIDFKNDSADVEGYSICVYKTKYKESAEALKEIQNTRKNNAADFIIRAYGKKIVIAADNKFGLELAIEHFMSNYCKDRKSSLPKNLNYVSSNSSVIKKITISGKPISDYRVVVSHVASYIESSAADYLIKEIARITGYELEKVTDHAAPVQNEIVIGETNRTSDDYHQYARSEVSNDFSISVQNGKVFIRGNLGQSYAANAGTIAFANLLKSKADLPNGFSHAGSYDGNYSLTNGYKLVWSDEFNSNKRSKVWYSKSGLLKEFTGLPWGGNLYVVSENVKFENGAMIQTVNRVGNDAHVTWLQTIGSEKMYFRYGYVEIRAKLPLVEGVTTSFFTQGPSVTEFLEIDCVETFGSLNTSKVNLHTWAPGGGGFKNLLSSGNNVYENLTPGISSPEPFGYKYHTFGFEWSDDRINFWYDGVLVNSFDCSSSAYDCFDKAVWLNISTRLSTSNYGNKTKADFVSGFASFDYVRIYQKENDGSILVVKK